MYIHMVNIVSLIYTISTATLFAQWRVDLIISLYITYIKKSSNYTTALTPPSFLVQALLHYVPLSWWGVLYQSYI